MSKADVRTLDLRGTGVVTVEGISGDNLVVKVPCNLIEKTSYTEAIKLIEEMVGTLKDCAHQAMIRGDERQRDLVKDALTRYNQWKADQNGKA